MLSIEIKVEETAVENIKSNVRDLRRCTIQLLAERSKYQRNK